MKSSTGRSPKFELDRAALLLLPVLLRLLLVLWMLLSLLVLLVLDVGVRLYTLRKRQSSECCTGGRSE